MFGNYEELPYFDETGNQYVQEIHRQDAYKKRGGRLSAPQMIKYENRVSMLVERLVLIWEAVQEDREAVKDYMDSIERNEKEGLLPRIVYDRFHSKIAEMKLPPPTHSERERDRLRVISGEGRVEEINVTTCSDEELIQVYRSRTVSSEKIFREFQRRERAGSRLHRLDPDAWGKYRSWLQGRRRKPRPGPKNER